MKKMRSQPLILFLIAVFLFIACNRPKEEIVRIGVILPLTGSAALIGEQHKAGLDVALEDYNAGKPERKITLIYEDDAADPKKAVSAANKLISVDKVDVIISVMTGSSMAILPITEAREVILFANCGHPTINELGKRIFRNFPNTRQEVQEMIPYLVNVRQYKKLGILYINDSFGKSAEELIVNKMNTSGGQIEFSIPYEVKAIDFRNIIAKIINENVEALYIFGYGDATANLLNQLRENKYPNLIVGNYNFSGPPVTVTSKVSLNGTIFTAPDFTVNTGDERALAFINSFREKTGKDPFWNAAVEYDALMLICEAINKPEKTLTDLPSVFSDLKEFQGVVGKYTLRGNEWLTPLTIKTFVNDTLTVVYKPDM